MTGQVCPTTIFSNDCEGSVKKYIISEILKRLSRLETRDFRDSSFYETDTRPRILRIIFRDPRRDQEFCKMIFRDRDETENSVK